MAKVEEDAANARSINVEGAVSQEELDVKMLVELLRYLRTPCTAHYDQSIT